MIDQKIKLIDEQTSPLFRVMWVYNPGELNRKSFVNNICAFHIGKGLILSVAHNLRSESGFPNSIPEDVFHSEIFMKLNDQQKQVFSQVYPLDPVTQKRYFNSTVSNPSVVIDTLKQINFDSRWVSLNKKNICKPYLIVQFKNNQFYNDAELTRLFDQHTNFAEPLLNRHTFIIELELSEAFYSDDIAMYKIINTNQSVIDKLPFVEPNYEIFDENIPDYHCLQSAPVGNLGRLLNTAKIEGFLDHHATFQDRIGGNYVVEGMRYLIRGYFRFGSSGAPYVFYDEASGKYKVNAVQSEASPIQLSINNSRDGNFQYVNAIASPLKNIGTHLERFLNA